jgi:hypothetical protein
MFPIGLPLPLILLTYVLMSALGYNFEYVQTLPSWSLITSYPASWLILSCVMISWWVALGFLLGIYTLREKGITSGLHHNSLATARYGLGPKPGTILRRIRIVRFMVRFITKLILTDIQQRLIWAIEVAGLWCYLCSWYGAHLFDVLDNPPPSCEPDRSEWSSPTFLNANNHLRAQALAISCPFVPIVLLVKQ